MQNPKNDENLPKSTIFEVFREDLRASVQRPPGARRRRAALRRAAGAQTPPLLRSGDKTRAQQKRSSRGGGHFAAPSLPRKRHRATKPTLLRALGTLRRQMTQFWVPSAHARVLYMWVIRNGAKNDCFLHVSRPVHPRVAPEDQWTACCDRGTSFGPTKSPCTERGRVDSSDVKSRYPPPSCTTPGRRHQRVYGGHIDPSFAKMICTIFKKKTTECALTHPMSSHAHTTVPPLTFLRGQGGVAPLCTPVRTTNASESARNDLSRGPEDLRARCKRFGSSKISKTKNRNFSPIRSTKRTFRGLCTPAPPPRTGRPRAAVGAHLLDLLHPPALKFLTSHIVFPTSHDFRLRSGPGPRAP